MREEFDDLARAVARGALSRRQALARFGKLTGGAVLASIGLGAARAGAAPEPPFEFNVVSPAASGQAYCAHIKPEAGACFHGFCTFSCPESPFDIGACFPSVAGGQLLCGGATVCSTTACTRNADCGGGEFCAKTCCPVPQQCVPICAGSENVRRPVTPVTPAHVRAAANGAPTTVG